MATLTLTINGVAQTVDAEPSMPLLWVLRDLLGLTGTKFSCGAGLCGACTVHRRRRSAALLRHAGLCVGADRAITTIEGLSADGTPSGAAGLAGRAGAAVRLLPGRPDHDRGGAAEPRPPAQRCRHRSPPSPITCVAAAPTCASGAPFSVRREVDGSTHPN